MASLPNVPAGPRPKRFPLELPLEVRVAGSDDWWTGTTEDISASGIRFRSSECVPPHTPVDIRFKLPQALTGDGHVRLLCAGHVVRSDQGPLLSHGARMAVAFSDFHLPHGRRRTARELQHAQNRSVGKEIGALIHRLNTLLFLIMGNSELLSTDMTVDVRVRDTATRNVRATEEAADIVRFLAAALKQMA